jgi:hypothetical protein
MSPLLYWRSVGCRRSICARVGLKTLRLTRFVGDLQAAHGIWSPLQEWQALTNAERCSWGLAASHTKYPLPQAHPRVATVHTPRERPFTAGCDAGAVLYFRVLRCADNFLPAWRGCLVCECGAGHLSGAVELFAEHLIGQK